MAYSQTKPYCKGNPAAVGHWATVIQKAQRWCARPLRATSECSLTDFTVRNSSPVPACYLLPIPGVRPLATEKHALLGIPFKIMLVATFLLGCMQVSRNRPPRLSKHVGCLMILMAGWHPEKYPQTETQSGSSSQPLYREIFKNASLTFL